jgi:hypothetical protein
MEKAGRIAAQLFKSFELQRRTSSDFSVAKLTSKYAQIH